MTADVYSGPLVVSALIEHQASMHGDRVAVTGSTTVTYAQLANDAARVCGGLDALGVEPGDRVATMLQSDVDYLGPWFGTAWAGAVEVPVNTDYKGEYLAHVLRQSESSVLFIEGAWLDRLHGLDLPDLRHVVVQGEPAGSPPRGVTLTPYEELATRAPSPRVGREEADLAYVIFTSGTTGPSRGAMQSNRCVFVTNVIPGSTSSA